MGHTISEWEAATNGRSEILLEAVYLNDEGKVKAALGWIKWPTRIEGVTRNRRVRWNADGICIQPNGVAVDNLKKYNVNFETP